jgi:hypothetical protein
MSSWETPTAALTDEEKSRLFELRKRSKQGEKLASFELKFVKRCHDEDPAYFDVIEARVFEETKPFGAA